MVERSVLRVVLSHLVRVAEGHLLHANFAGAATTRKAPYEALAPTQSLPVAGRESRRGSNTIEIDGERRRSAWAGSGRRYWTVCAIRASEDRLLAGVRHFRGRTGKSDVLGRAQCGTLAQVFSIFTLPCPKRNGCPQLLSAIFPDFS